MKSNIKHLTISGLILFVFCFSTHFCFSSKNHDATSELITNIGNSNELSSKKDFSFCGSIQNNDTNLIVSANKINRAFYNYRDVVCITQNGLIEYENQPVSFSNSSQLDSQKVFATNHLTFAGPSESPYCDMDFFTKPSVKNSNDGNTVISVLVPLTMANEYATKAGISLKDTLYKKIDFKDKKARNYDYYIAGIWDNTITYQSYYQYNQFYGEVATNLVFVNNNLYPFGADTSTLSYYLLFGNNASKNHEFLHYCRNEVKTSFGIELPSYKINNFEINGITSHDFYQKINSLYESNFIKVTFYVSLIALILSGIAFLIFLFMFLLPSANSLLYVLVCPLLMIISTVLFIPITKIKYDVITPFAFSQGGLITGSIFTLLMTGILTVSYLNKRNKKIVSEPEKQETLQKAICFVSFDDLNGNSATSIRVKNYIDIISSNSIPWCHVGFFDSKLSTENNIGIKKSKHKVFNYVWGPIRFVNRLNKLFKTYRFETMFVYSPLPLFSSIAILYFAKKKKIRIVHDVTEYQNFSEVNLKKPGWFYFSNTFYNRNLISYKDHVICITTYLENYFKNKGCKTIVIPPIFNKTQYPKIIKANQKQYTFSYLGNPGKKDNLDYCIIGFANYLKNNSGMIPSFKIQFVGANKDRYNQILSQYDLSIQNCFVFMNKCRHDEIAEIYKNSSFTFFLRDPKKRFSKAGFPSKAVESLFFSTPIITNDTSDLLQYLTDNQEIFIVEDYSALAFEKRINAIIEKKVDLISCQNKCREKAEQSFASELFSLSFLDFVFPIEKQENKESSPNQINV